MGRGLARRLSAVMTGGAAARCHGAVIEPARSPGSSGMTTIAGRRGWNVVGGFACGCLPVMTSYALVRGASETKGVVVKTSDAPYSGGVTQITLRAGRNVIRRFYRRRDTGSARVAASTDSWCAFEYSAHVTRFTFHRAMRADKRESGFQVIETGCSSLVLG